MESEQPKIIKNGMYYHNLRKNDPEYVAQCRERRKNYYWNNQERLSQKALERWYSKRGLQIAI
jgi:hypothetical protein